MNCEATVVDTKTTSVLALVPDTTANGRFCIFLRCNTEPVVVAGSSGLSRPDIILRFYPYFIFEALNSSYFQ